MSNELSAGVDRPPNPASSKCVPSWIWRKFFQGSDIFTLQKTDKLGSIGNFC